jgi:BolA family transcriptional regulator, general stress-responsive regulator
MTTSIHPGPTTEEVARRLERAFRPTRLDVIDESGAHAGHGGHRAGVQTHIAVRLSAPAIEGLTRVAATRLVHKELKDLLDPPVGTGSIHALSIQILS